MVFNPDLFIEISRAGAECLKRKTGKPSNPTTRDIGRCAAQGTSSAETRADRSDVRARLIYWKKTGLTYDPLQLNGVLCLIQR